MTFKKFAAIAAAKRPDVVVANHGSGKCGTQKVLVAFNGGKSKAYSYTGSYADILNRLGIKVVTAADMATIKDQLERAIANNGKINLFSKKPMDTTTEIAALQSKIDAFNSDEYVRDWE